MGMHTLHKGMYEVIRELGRGGNGRVLLVRDRQLGKYWAIKELPLGENTDDRSCIREAEVLLSLNHPGVVRITGMFEENGCIYLVMDYIRGSNLKEIQKKNGCFSEIQVIRWGMELCDILQYMHSASPQVIYRDLKPSNIVLQENGHLILIDFGTAGPSGSVNEHSGTRGFAAPEQLDPYGSPDARSDIYALGACLFYMLTGKYVSPSQEGNSAVTKVLYPEISEEMGRILSKCMEKDPALRYQAAETVKQELKEWKAICENPGKHGRRKRKRKSPHRKRKGIAVIILLIGGITAGITVYGSAMEEKEARYQAFLTEAEKNEDELLRRQALLNAAALVPADPTAYEALLEIYIEDDMFSDDEEAELLSLDESMGKQSILRSDKNLEKKIGECYWYYYSSESNDFSGMIDSLYWFEQTAGEGNGSKDDLVNKYIAVGKFLSDAAEENTAKNSNGIYESLYYDLYRLCTDSYIRNSSDEFQKKRICWLTEMLLNIYTKDMNWDGITKSEIRILKEKAWELITDSE